MAKRIKDASYGDPTTYLLSLVKEIDNRNKEPIEEEPLEKAGEEVKKTVEMIKTQKPYIEKVNGEEVDPLDIEAEVEAIMEIANWASDKADENHRQYTKPDEKELANMSLAELRKWKNRMAQAKQDLSTAMKKLDRAEKEKNADAIKTANEAVQNAWNRLQVRFINTGLGEKTQSIKRSETTLENIEEEQRNIPEERLAEKQYGEYWVNLLCKYLERNLPGHPIFALDMSSDAIGRFPKKGEKESGRINQPAYNKLAVGSMTEQTGIPRVALTGYVNYKVTEDQIKKCVDDFGKEYPESGAKYESGKVYTERTGSKVNPASEKQKIEEEERMMFFNDWIIWVRFEGEKMKNMPYTKTGRGEPSDDYYGAYAREYGLKSDSVKKAIPYSKFNDALSENPLKNVRENMFEMPNGEVVYVEYLDGKLIGGPATNTGIIPLVTIDYDEDMTVDANLEAVYNELLENLDWDYDAETGRYDSKKSCKDADEWRFKLAKRRNSYDEYVIRAYRNGKYDEEATYYTDDWDDAVGTLTDIAQRQGLKVREEKSGFVADSCGKATKKDSLSEYEKESIEKTYNKLKNPNINLNESVKEYLLKKEPHEDKLYSLIPENLTFDDVRNGILNKKSIDEILNYDKYLDSYYKSYEGESNVPIPDEQYVCDIIKYVLLYKLNINEDEFERFILGYFYNQSPLSELLIAQKAREKATKKDAVKGQYEYDYVDGEKWYVVGYEEKDGKDVISDSMLTNDIEKAIRFAASIIHKSDYIVIQNNENGKSRAMDYEDADEAYDTFTAIEYVFNKIKDSKKKPCKDDVLKNYDKEWHFREDEIFDVAQYLMNWYPESVPDMEAGDIQDRLYGADGLTFEGCPYTFYMEEEEDE